MKAKPAYANDEVCSLRSVCIRSISYRNPLRFWNMGILNVLVRRIGIVNHAYAAT
jgi:hypothetical protein